MAKLYSHTGVIALLTGATGFLASVVPDLPETSQIEAVGKWPLTIILGVVCCFLAWLNYRQGVAFQHSAIKQAEANRIAAEKTAESHAQAITHLTAAQTAMIEKLAAANNKVSELLMQRPCIRERVND